MYSGRQIILKYICLPHEHSNALAKNQLLKFSWKENPSELLTSLRPGGFYQLQKLFGLERNPSDQNPVHLSFGNI